MPNRLIGGVLLIVFAYWFIEERPQYIEVDFAPISYESWGFIEFATRYDDDGHYWIVRYKDTCYADCYTWLGNFDYFESQLQQGWIASRDSIRHSNYCERYSSEFSSDNVLEVKIYRHKDSYYPPSLICVATLQTEYDRDYIELWVMTIRASPLTELRINIRNM